MILTNTIVLTYSINNNKQYRNNLRVCVNILLTQTPVVNPFYCWPLFILHSMETSSIILASKSCRDIFPNKVILRITMSKRDSKAPKSVLFRW